VQRISNTTSIMGEPETIGPSLEAIAAISADDVLNMAEDLFEGMEPRLESVGPGEGPGLPG
jgi:alkanesulfonate monooxygenase SsuD/methylene tetrahydromethanopterin reductase-like flavin-dependent oxidoreductase (luciferase family)